MNVGIVTMMMMMVVVVVVFGIKLMAIATESDIVA